MPAFSVLIPTFDRPALLSGLLEAWAAVESPSGSYEIVLADDGSSRSPEEIVRPFFGRLPLRFLALPHEGLSATRQSLLEAATGDYILITDDDCRPEPGLLRCYERAVTEGPSLALGGRVINLLPGDVFAETTHTITTFVTEAWNAGPDGVCFFTGSNVLFPRKMLLGIGGFDRGWKCRTGEDRDLCRRWLEAGHHMAFVPDAVMGHAHALDFRGFLMQHFHYGQGRWWTEHRRRMARQGAPGSSPPEFYIRLLMAPWKIFPPAKAMRIFVLLCFAQVATACGSIEAAWSHRGRGG